MDEKNAELLRVRTRAAFDAQAATYDEGMEGEPKLEDMIEIAKYLESKGIDGFNFSVGVEERTGAPETLEMRRARPLTDKWTFSTNGVSIMGRNGIPCIGFGPGAEAQAHAPNEKTWKQDLVTCAAVYAALPSIYCK